jgi:hypothetical protein
MVRLYNAAVDFVDRYITKGRGGKTAYIDLSRNLTYGQLGYAAVWVGPMLATSASNGKTASPWWCSTRSISRSCFGVRSAASFAERSATGRPARRLLSSTMAISIDRAAICCEGPTELQKLIVAPELFKLHDARQRQATE